MLGEDLCFWPAPSFGPKTGLNLSEDLFFFWSSSDFGQENRTDCGWKNFYSDLCYSQIFWAPPFQNPASATVPEELWQKKMGET